MKPIEQALALLIGREATSEEIARFYKVKELCNFSEHDSVWSMLLAFGHYEILYGEIPGRIAKETREQLALHKDALEAAASAAEKHIKGNLVDSTAQAAREMANQVIESATRISNADSRRKLVFGTMLGAGLAAAMLGLAIWSGFSIGSKMSAAEAAWLHTPEGQAARVLSDLNGAASMLQCAGYQKRSESGKAFCVPYDEKSRKVSGWRIQ